MLIYVDCDGCLTKTYKITNGGETFKPFSDKDAFAIECLRNDLVMISQDRNNAGIASRKKIRFVESIQGVCGKYDSLVADYRRYTGIKDAIAAKQYIYLGDSVYDLECIANAAVAFVPRDCSILLRKKVEKLPNVVPLNANGGCGCLDEMAYHLAMSDYQISGLTVIRNLLDIPNGQS